MSETITMTVVAARQRLQNTRAMSGEQIDEACDRCHRSPELTSEQWHAQQVAEREAADAHLRATDAAAPDPRAALSEALAGLETAKAGLSKLQAALPAARGALAAAQLKHERASEEAEMATERAAASLLAGFQGAPTGPAPSPAVPRRRFPGPPGGQTRHYVVDQRIQQAVWRGPEVVPVAFRLRSQCCVLHHTLRSFLRPHRAHSTSTPRLGPRPAMVRQA